MVNLNRVLLIRVLSVCFLATLGLSSCNEEVDQDSHLNLLTQSLWYLKSYNISYTQQKSSGLDISGGFIFKSTLDFDSDGTFIMADMVDSSGLDTIQGTWQFKNKEDALLIIIDTTSKIIKVDALDEHTFVGEFNATVDEINTNSQDDSTKLLIKIHYSH